MTKVNLGSYAPYVIHVCRFATATRNHPPARHFERQQPQHPLCTYHAECPPSMIKSDPVRTFELAPAAKRQQLPLDFVSYIVFRPQQQIVPAFPRRTQLPWHILHCPATSADKDHTCFSARIQQPSIRLCCLLAADSSPCFTHRVPAGCRPVGTYYRQQRHHPSPVHMLSLCHAAHAWQMYRFSSSCRRVISHDDELIMSLFVSLEVHPDFSLAICHRSGLTEQAQLVEICLREIKP
jgi:hypothetical protein